MSDTIILGAQCLTSKWGFHDGDQLEWIDEVEELSNFDSHILLIHLVKTKLLPAIPHHVEVHAMETLHNPIRIIRIDDTEIDSDFEFDNPVTVAVSREEVLETAHKLNGTNK